MLKFFAVHLAVILRDRVEFIRWRGRGLDNLEGTVVVRNQGIITRISVMVNHCWINWFGWRYFQTLHWTEVIFSPWHHLDFIWSRLNHVTVTLSHAWCVFIVVQLILFSSKFVCLKLIEFEREWHLDIKDRWSGHEI